MKYAIAEIKRIIETATKDADWEEKDYLFSEIEKFIEEMREKEKND